MGSTDREPPDAAAARRLAGTLRAEGVRDARVLEAFGEVLRSGFVPPGAVADAYADRPIPIAHGQVTTQPSLIGRMVEALRLTGDERVLEVGTGLGFQTAVLARLAREVVSIERFPELAGSARANLRGAGMETVTVVVGDGTAGVPDRAPYDAIVVSAAAPTVPPPLIEQLKLGGRLVQPIGPGGAEQVTAFRRVAGGLRRERVVCHAYFVPLVGRFGVRQS